MLIRDGYVNDVHSNEVWKYRKSVISRIYFHCGAVCAKYNLLLFIK